MGRARQLHRADLHTILLEAVLENDSDAITLNHRVAAIDQNEDFATITFTNGNTVQAETVIGSITESPSPPVGRFLSPYCRLRTGYQTCTPNIG